MDRRTRQELLGQWGPRQPTERELAQGRKVSADLEGSPVKGMPLRPRRSPFRPAVDSYLTSLGGPLPYMMRLRELEQRARAAELELERRWRQLAAECAGDGVAFESRWREEAERYDFAAVNELIERHNRWYPVEARLPMDVRRRDYVLVNGSHYSRRRLDAAWALERFPPELRAVTTPGA
ncbi:MAG: hypothetical protein IT201_05835 [Thermoleophilia bacterium]|nr:hypothetical protein [Thermoleophilia bacterium]